MSTSSGGSFIRKRGENPSNHSEDEFASLKDFYEIAAVQSGVGSRIYDVPESLQGPLVTVSDPASIISLVYADIDFGSLERKILAGSRSPMPYSTPARSEGAEDYDEDTGYVVDDVNRMEVTSAVGTPQYEYEGSRKPSPTDAAEKKHSVTPMEICDFEMDDDSENLVEKARKAKIEKEKLVDELFELCKTIKKQVSDSYGSFSSWIDENRVHRISHLIVISMSFMPNVLTIDEVINSLLVSNGPEVFVEVIKQMPELFHSFFNNIVGMQTFDVGKNKIRGTVIKNVLDIYPEEAMETIEKLVTIRGDCQLACKIATDLLDDVDFLQFLEPQLINRESHLSLVVLRSGGRQILPLIIARLLKMANDVVEGTIPENPIAKPPLSTRLLYCIIELLWTSERWKPADIILISRFVFRTAILPADELVIDEMNDVTMTSANGDLMTSSFDPDFNSFNPELDDSIVADSESSQDAVESTPPKSAGPTSFANGFTSAPLPPSPFGDAHETMVLAALVAVPYFLQFPPTNVGPANPPDPSIHRWLEAAKRRTQGINDKLVDSPFSEALIYVHSCALSGKMDDLAKFSSEILKRKVDISQRHTMAHMLKNLLISRCLSEGEVARRSVILSTTTDLSEDTSGRLPLHSIWMLQAAGFMKAFEANIGPWLERQLLTVKLPANAILAEIVETFAIHTAAQHITGLSWEYIDKVFLGDVIDQKLLVTRIYVLLFLLAYREQAEKSGGVKKNPVYPSTIYTRMPVKFLMSVVEIQHNEFEHVRSRVISRFALMFPYMMPTARSIEIVTEALEDSRKPSASLLDNSVLQKIQDVVTKPRSTSAYNFLQKIYGSPISDQIRVLPQILEAFMASLDSETPRRFLALIVKIFERFDEIVPRILHETAATVWFRGHDTATYHDVYKIPVLLFRCDKRILNSPPHFGCFISTLRFFSFASRWDLRLKMMLMAKHVQHMAGKYSREHERHDTELFPMAYADSQQAVTVQALIEVGDAIRMKDDPDDLAMQVNREEIAKMAFAYIHRVFIDQPDLMKIVLFLMYPMRLMRSVIEGVPSMYVATNYIQEMLAFPHLERRVFAVVLTAELTRKYRLPETLELARMCCDVVHTLHKHGELPAWNKTWRHLAPALVLLSSSFPSLTDCVTRLLERVAANAKARMAMKYELMPKPNSEESQLLDVITECLGNKKVIYEE